MIKHSFSALRLGIAAVAIVALSGCESWVGNENVPPPVGIGSELYQLKRSPCACLEIPQQWQPPTHQAHGRG